MNKPEPMTQEQINLLNDSSTDAIDLAHAIIAARDAQWEKMLGEPVAWLEGNDIYWHNAPDINDWIRKNGQPLYTHPAPEAKQPVNQQLLDALKDAATSMETISRLAGKVAYLGDDGERIPTYMEHHDQVRGYAISRAQVTRAAIAAAEQAQPTPTVERKRPDDTEGGAV